MSAFLLLLFPFGLLLKTICGCINHTHYSQEEESYLLSQFTDIVDDDERIDCVHEVYHGHWGEFFFENVSITAIHAYVFDRETDEVKGRIVSQASMSTSQMPEISVLSFCIGACHTDFLEALIDMDLINHNVEFYSQLRLFTKNSTEMRFLWFRRFNMDYFVPLFFHPLYFEVKKPSNLAQLSNLTQTIPIADLDWGLLEGGFPFGSKGDPYFEEYVRWRNEWQLKQIPFPSQLIKRPSSKFYYKKPNYPTLTD
jgi:hypothetical protein